METKTETIREIANKETTKLLTDKAGKVDHDTLIEVRKYQEPEQNLNVKLLHEKKYLKNHQVNFKSIKTSFGFE